MKSLSNFFDNLKHHQNAQTALEKAKEIEASRLAAGATYQKVNDPNLPRTWRLKKSK